MATASTVFEETPSTSHTGNNPNASGLLVSLSTLAPDALQSTLANLTAAFAGRNVDVATPDSTAREAAASGPLRMIPYTPQAPLPSGWLLTAVDFIDTYKLMQENKSSACLLLGPEAQSLSPEALRALADSIQTEQHDLTIPHYELGPRDGLVNSAILYPVTRALFGTKPRFPLAIDLAFSSRMAERLAAAAQKFTAAGQNAALLWPVAEAATASFSIAEVPAEERTLPPPDATDLNSLLAQVAGSLFADIDAKASFWQRARLAYSPRTSAAGATVARAEVESGNAGETAEGAEMPDVKPMLESFRLAYTNLHEIWSLVLPPNSLLGLKKLSSMPPASFLMPDSLWARIVYDFILAYRLRTINRSHLLGALTPLYLAWVASHLLLTSGTGPNSMEPEKHIETLAAAFEADKPYLVSRWRWPDRFNP
jgi:glucosylglycerate synthase